MRITFRQVEIFWAVMTSGNVTRAAALLRTSQPTVSREITRFEHVLGIKLFERIQGRLHPTSQSLTLFEEVKNSYFGLERIGHLAESIKAFKGGLRQVVRKGRAATTAVGLVESSVLIVSPWDRISDTAGRQAG